MFFNTLPHSDLMKPVFDETYVFLTFPSYISSGFWVKQQHIFLAPGGLGPSGDFDPRRRPAGLYVYIYIT